MAVHQEQIDSITNRLETLDQQAEELERSIEQSTDSAAKERSRAELQEVNRVREALDAERSQLIDQQQAEKSAGGNLAEQATDNEDVGVARKQELSQDEVRNLESDQDVEDDIDALEEEVERLEAEAEGDQRADNISVGTDDSDAGKEQRALSSQSAKTPQNKLHQYESYTYRITLYALTREELLSLTTNPKAFTPRHVLVSSSGSYALGADKGGRVRHPDFQEDFYFEDFDFTTVVGMNSKSKASNSLTIKFTLVEPYGLTLLDRLFSVAEMPPFNCPNYLELPYLIEIDFIANPTGSIAGSNESHIVSRKRIPIKFIGMRISPGVEGSVYKIDAIPFNHLAFMNTVAAVPASVSVVAGTVGEFFAEDQSEDNRAENKERIDKELEKLKLSLLFGGAVLTPEAQAAERARIEGQYVDRVSSYPAVYNQHFAEIAGEGEEQLTTEPQSKIKFLIDEEIANSPIVREVETESRTTKLNDLDEDFRSTVKDGLLSFGKVKQDFPISAGTHIVQLIDRVVKKSEYIQSQVKEVQAAREELAEAEKNNNNEGARVAEEKLRKYKMLNWYKVIPQVTIGNFDEKTNKYAKEVTYSIKKHKVANSFHPEFEKSRIKKSKISRSYNYLYTGLNQDIIDLAIDFDSTYFTSVQAYKKNKSLSSGGKTESRGNTGARIRDEERNNKIPGVGNQINDQGSTYHASTAAASEAGQAHRQDESISQVINDLSESLYSSQRGDMLNIRCKIVGDPSFIKQDDVYFNPASEGYDDYVPSGDLDSAPINLDGDITFDGEQVYVQILVKNSVDIDDSIGIQNKGLAGGNGKVIKLTNGRNINGTFSGVYKVLVVQNTFSGGEFVQTLDLVRMPNNILEDEVPDTQSSGITVTDQTVEKESDPVPTGNVDADENENGVFAQDIARLAPANATTAETIDADNINDSDIVTEVGTQAPEQQQRGIFAGDIPSTENLG